MFINQQLAKFLTLLFCFSIFSSIAQTIEDLPLNNIVINESPKPISSVIFDDFSGNKIDLKNKKTMKISFDAESLEEALYVSQKFGELFSQTFSL